MNVIRNNDEILEKDNAGTKTNFLATEPPFKDKAIRGCCSGAKPILPKDVKV